MHENQYFIPSEVTGIYVEAAMEEIGSWLCYLYSCVETGMGMETKLIKFCKTTDFFSGQILFDSYFSRYTPFALFMNMVREPARRGYPKSAILNCQVPELRSDILKKYYVKLVMEKGMIENHDKGSDQKLEEESSIWFFLHQLWTQL